MPDVYLFLDFDDVFARLRQKRLPVTAESLAQDLSRAARFLGRVQLENLRVIALWHLAAEAVPAFERAGFIIVPAAAEDELLRTLEAELERLADGMQPADVLVVVSSRPELAPLLRQLDQRCDLRVWGVEGEGLGGSAGAGLQFLALEDGLGLKVKRQVLVIDFENVSRTLADLGYAVDIDQLIRGFKQQAAKTGELVRAYAYADWWKLPPVVRSNGAEAGEVATIFELHGIQTRNTPSLGGKNAADMRIVEDVHAIMNGPRPPDVLILASGDRDFASLSQEIKTLGAEVIVWGVRGKTSRALESIASQLDYIQDFVPLSSAPPPAAYPIAEVRPPVNGAPAPAEAAPAGVRPGRLTQLVLFTDALMSRNRWSWAWQGVLISELARAGEFGSEEEAKALLNRAIEEGVMTRQQVHHPTPSVPDRWVWACRPNEEHPIVRAARLVPTRVLALLREDLELMPYVAFSRLKERMAGDAALQQPWLPLDDPSRTEWISFLGQVGVVRLGKRPHHRNPRDLVTFVEPATEPADPAQSAGARPVPRSNGAVEQQRPAGALAVPSDAAIEAMLTRIVVSVDHFARRSGWGWAPLRSLRHRLQAFGRAEVDAAMSRAQAEGHLTLQPHENPDPNKPHTTGVHLGETELVRTVLERRDRLVRGLAEAQRGGAQLSRRHLLELLDGPDAAEAARLWLSVLEFEQVLRPVDPPWLEERHYLLALDNAVVRTLLGEAAGELSFDGADTD